MAYNSVTDQFDEVDQQPDEAAKVVDTALNLGLDVKEYSANQDYFKTNVEAAKTPERIHPVLSEYAGFSKEQAALVYGDVDNLNKMGQIWDQIKDGYVNKSSRLMQITDLTMKKMTNYDNFTQAEDDELWQLNQDLKDSPYNTDEVVASIPGELGTQAGLMTEMVKRNYEMIGKAGMASAGLFAAGGLAIPIPGASVVGAGYGFAAGVGIGAVGAFGLDSIKLNTALTYGELSEIELPDGRLLDESTKNKIAFGAGIAMGVIETAVGRTVAKTVPGLRKFVGGSKWIREIVLNPKHEAMKRTLLELGEATMISGGGEGAQETISVLAEALGKVDGNFSDADFESALVNALPQRDEQTGELRAGRIGQATVVGGVLPIAISATVSPLNYAVRVANMSVKGSPDADAPAVNTAQMLGNKIKSATKSLDFEMKLGSVIGIESATKLTKLSKAAAAQLQEQFIAQTELPYLFMDFDELQELNLKQDVKDRVRDILQPKDVEITNAPVQVSTLQFLQLAAENPELISIVTPEVDVQSPNKARDFLTLVDKTNEKAKKMIAGLKDGESLDPVVAQQLVDEALGKKSVYKKLTDEQLKKIQPQDVTIKDGQKIKLQPKFFDDFGDTQNIEVQSFDENGQELGSVGFQQTEKGVLITAAIVKEDLRRKGIATKMYDYINENFGEILPGQGLSDDGKPFRFSYDKNRDKIYDEQYDDVTDQVSYVNAPTVPESARAGIPEGELKKMEQARREARLARSKRIEAGLEYEFDKIRSITEQEAMDAQVDLEVQKLENHPGLELVKKFTEPEKQTLNYIWLDKRIVDDPTETHQQKGYSPYAIDPRTLDAETRKKFTRSKKLQRMKVFVNGGLPAGEAATRLGFNTPNELLKQLSETPDAQTLAEAKAAKYETQIKTESQEQIQPTDHDVKVVYDNPAQNHLDEAKWIANNAKGVGKLEVKTLALGIHTLPQLAQQAKEIIQSTKLAQLSFKQFQIGERRADRAAFKAWSKSDLYNVVKQKERAALNLQLEKESRAALQRSNRDLRYVRRFWKDKDTITALKQAGPMYFDAVQDLLESFNLRPDTTAERNAIGKFREYVDKAAKMGFGNFDLPARFNDARVNAKDMTVEELSLVTDRLRTILHHAKRWNKVTKQRSDRIQSKYIEGVADYFKSALQQLPQFDPAKLDERQADNKQIRFLRGTPELLRRVEFVMQQLDGGELNGPIHQTLFQPLVDAGNKKAQDIERVFGHIEKAIVTYGKEDFAKLNSTEISIPEFEKVVGLKGKATKGQLLMMLMNFGNEGNISRLENFGVNRVDILKVLERYLDERDLFFVQDVWNTIEAMRPEVAKVIKEADGIEPEWVEAKDFMFKGKLRKGGYFRIIYNNEVGFSSTKEILQDATERKSLEQIAQDKHYAQAMTKQGHLFERVGSDRTLDLSTSNFNQVIEEILHDIHFRIPIKDVARIISDDTVARSMVSVVGKGQYTAIAQWVADVANSNLDAGRQAKTSNTVMRILYHLSGAQNVVYLGWRYTVVGMQLASLPAAPLKMGPSGVKYMSIALKNLSGNPTKYNEMVDFVADRFPELRLRLKNLDLSADNSLARLTPSEIRNNFKLPLNAIDLHLKYQREIAFSAIGIMDQFATTVVWQSAYMQAMNGEAYNIIAGDEAAAIKYAGSVVRTTTTANNMVDRAPIQKIKIISELFAKFFSQMSIINNLWTDSWNELHDGVIRSKKEYQNGQYKSASKELVKGAGQMTAVVLLLGILPELWQKIIKGEPLPGSEDSEEDWMKFILKTPVKSFAGGVPVLRDAAFVAFQNTDYTRNVGLPVTRTITDMVNAGLGLLEIAKATVKLDSPELTEQQKRGMLNSLGIISGGLPTEAIWQLLVQTEDIDITRDSADQYKKLSKKIRKFLLDPQNQAIAEPIRGALNEIAHTLDPEVLTVGSSEIPNETYQIIKQIESDGKWYAENPQSSAAGLYQFTKGTWDWVTQSAPELGLTEDGRINSDTSQQEAAMRWFTQYNVDKMKLEEIDITSENIYAAHFLGVAGAIKVLTAPDTYKLSTLVGTEVMTANNFDSKMKVKDFKQWLTDKIEQGREKIDKVQE